MDLHDFFEIYKEGKIGITAQIDEFHVDNIGVIFYNTNVDQNKFLPLFITDQLFYVQDK